MLTLDEIKNNESKNIEFKEVIPQDYKKFLKTVVAYSNCAGGKIIFGIQDGTLEPVGIKDDIHQTIDRLTNIISDSVTPQIIPNIYVEKIEGVEVIVLEVFHGSNTPYYITSLGKENGMLLGIKADRIVVNFHDDIYTIDNVIIGIYSKSLNNSGKYNAIIGLDVLQNPIKTTNRKLGEEHEFITNTKV